MEKTNEDCAPKLPPISTILRELPLSLPTLPVHNFVGSMAPPQVPPPPVLAQNKEDRRGLNRRAEYARGEGVRLCDLWKKWDAREAELTAELKALGKPWPGPETMPAGGHMKRALYLQLLVHEARGVVNLTRCAAGQDTGFGGIVRMHVPGAQREAFDASLIPSMEFGRHFPERMTMSVKTLYAMWQHTGLRVQKAPRTHSNAPYDAQAALTYVYNANVQMRIRARIMRRSAIAKVQGR